MFEPDKDPYDDQVFEEDSKSFAAMKKMKFTRTLVHSMKMGSKEAVKIGYTSQGLKVINDGVDEETGKRETSERDCNRFIEAAEEKKRRRAVLFPNMSQSDIDKKFMRICNDDPSWKKFVNSYKKIRKSGVKNLDLDTMLRGLLHPSDYREVIHKIVVEPKVTIGRVVKDEMGNQVVEANIIEKWWEQHGLITLPFKNSVHPFGMKFDFGG